MSKVSQLKAIAFQLAPKAIQGKIRAIAEDKKMAHWQECFKTKVPREEVDELFSKLALGFRIYDPVPGTSNQR